MRRPSRVLTVTLAAWLLGSPVALAASEVPASVWGGSGLILVPTTDVLGFTDMRATGGYFVRKGQLMGGFHMGLLRDLEAGVVYGAPDAGGALSGDFKYRLLKQSAQVPFSLALGGQLLAAGSPAAAYGLSNQLYMMLGHELAWNFDGKPVTLGRAALGFAGNLAGAELLAGLQIPVLQYGSLEAEYIGNRPNQDALVNVGLTATPLPWLGVRVASIGEVSTPILDREWFLGVRLAWDVPTGGDPFTKAAAQPEKTPAPAKPEQKPLPAPPVVSPPPTPDVPAPSASPSPVPAEGVVEGRVRHGDQPVARIPLQLIGGVTRKAWSEADGSYRFPRAPVGTYKLKIEREGWKPIEQEVIVVPGTTEVAVSLVALPATLKGLVQHAQKGVGGITVSIEALGISTLTKGDGTFVLPDLPAGTHVVTYHRQKELLDKATLTLGQGETLQRNLTLKPGDMPAVQKALMRGTITDGKASLSGVRVTLEGKDLTVMTISGPDGGFLLRDLPAGAYKLSVAKTGFKSRFFSLTLKAGQEVKHTIALTAGN